MYEQEESTELEFEEYDFNVELYARRLMGLEYENDGYEEEPPKEILDLWERHEKGRACNPETESINLGSEEDPKMVKIGTLMTTEQRADMIEFLKSYKNVFAWSYQEARHRPRGSPTPTHTRGQACQREAEKMKARVESENERRSYEAVPSRVICSVYISGMARQHCPCAQERHKG